MMLLEIISGRGNSEEDCTSDRGQATYFHMQVASFLRVMSNSLVDRELVGDVNLVEVPIKKKIWWKWKDFANLPVGAFRTTSSNDQL